MGNSWNGRVKRNFYPKTSKNVTILKEKIKRKYNLRKLSDTDLFSIIFDPKHNDLLIDEWSKEVKEIKIKNKLDV